MIVAKILLLLSPLLVVNAQGGGRFGYFSRPDFRRRPWDRPTVSPVPDTPMPTEKVTAHITDSPRAKTELPTNTYVSPTTGAPASSVPRWSPRGRVWGRPGFQGSRNIGISTPEAITPTESNPKANYSPAVSVVSSTTAPQVYIITPSAIVPSVDNHAQYKDPSNFNSNGEYSSILTHNKDEIQAETTKPITELPSTTEKITDFSKTQTTTPTEGKPPIVSSSSTATESVRYTIGPTTAVPYINSDTKYNESLKNNLDFSFPVQASLHLNELKTELNTTPESLTTPRVTNFNSNSRFPPYMSHNSNVPTESAGYTVSPSTNIPFADGHEQHEDLYLTTKAPIPFKIISTTEAASETTKQNNPIYQENYTNTHNVASGSELILGKAVTMPTKEPEKYIVIAPTTTTKAPFIDIHKEYNNSFTSQLSVEYTNGQKKSNEITSSSDYYNSQIYPVYNHETEKVSHYEQYSSATGEPERTYSVATPTEAPFIDLHKTYDGGFTSGPPVEYTNGHAKTSEIPSSAESKERVPNIYRNNNYKWNDYDHSVTPKVIDTTQSTISYQYRYPISSTEQSELTKNMRHTNSYRYTDMTTKPAATTTRYTTTITKPTTTTTPYPTTTKQPTTPYTTTTKKPTTTTRYTTTARLSRLNNAYDVENFKCKQEDAYFSISNQCDQFIECKSGYPIQNTCPDGLHFNPAAKYPEFPCAFPSEVKCDSNSVIRQAEPTFECPHRYGYFSLQDRCDKYIMCQEGQATVMSCPAGLAFSVATSSCDWPSNVPGCVPDVFKGFTCPEPELNEDGEPIHSIYKYRYDKSCRKYIACQKGHPRLLSCDSGLAFDENSESCINDFDVADCTS